MQQNTFTAPSHFNANANPRTDFEPNADSPRASFPSEASILGYWLLPLRWAALSRGRRALLNLNQDQLADIGISKEEAMQEGRRPVWDAP